MSLAGRGGWPRLLLILAAVWLAVGAAVYLARSAKPTAASFAAYVREHPLEGLESSRRAEVLEEMARRLNRLNFEERQKLREERFDRDLFRQLTPEERRQFLERTMPEGFRQLMLALNAMKPEERRRIVRRALEDIERDSPEIASRISEEDAQKVMAEGLGAFYEEASAEVKLDFAPVIERLQQATQGLR
ncbi:MAG: hypothetical protein N2322_01835 [Terrimicrobiaceae bacterium]|nr:hypothetical protein [Terrimicrobiaceae bacterium]